MPFLSIGGTDVSVANDTVDREEFAVGEVRAAFSGAPRSSVRAYKKRWSMSTIPLTRTAANTLEGLLQANPPLTIAGDLTGSISGYASDIKMHSQTNAAGAELVVVSFRLWEP